LHEKEFKQKGVDVAMRQKKADISSKYLISVFILIASFAVILVLLWRINLTDEIDKQTCYESLVLRSTFNLGPLEVGRENIPLKCRTEKICLTMSGKDCEEFGLSSKENPITKIKLDSSSTKARAEAIDAIANALYDCHAMMGQGKLAFMPSAGWLSSETKYCLICSRIAFDEKAKESLAEIAYLEVYKRMSEKKDSSGVTYLSFVYPGLTNWQDVGNVYLKILDKGEASGDQDVTLGGINQWKINPPIEYAILYQILQEGKLKQTLTTSGTFAGGVVLTLVGAGVTGFTGPIGIAIMGIGLKLTTVASGIMFAYNSPSGNFQYIPSTIVPYDYESLKGISCDSFETSV